MKKQMKGKATKKEALYYVPLKYYKELNFFRWRCVKVKNGLMYVVPRKTAPQWVREHDAEQVLNKAAERR